MAYGWLTGGRERGRVEGTQVKQGRYGGDRVVDVRRQLAGHVFRMRGRE
jgi:hypothetical protein